MWVVIVVGLAVLAGVVCLYVYLRRSDLFTFLDDFHLIVPQDKNLD